MYYSYTLLTFERGKPNFYFQNTKKTMKKKLSVVVFKFNLDKWISFLFVCV